MSSTRLLHCFIPCLLAFTGALSCGGDEFTSPDQPSQGGSAGVATGGSNSGGSSIGGASGVGGADAGEDASQSGGAAGASGAGGIGGAGQGGEAGAETGGSSTGGANTGGMGTGGMGTGGMGTGGIMNTGGMGTGGVMNTGGMGTGGIMNTGGMGTGGMNIGGSGTGGALGETACMDNVDNDLDGMADCADSECTSGYRCAGALPAGWLSIGYLNLTNPAAACPPEYPSKISLKDPAALPASQKCECSCNNAGAVCTSYAACGASCTSPSIVQYSIEEFCGSFGNGNNTTCRLSPPVPAGGTCLMNFTKPGFSWAESGRFCQRDSNQGYGSCPDKSMVCVPKSAGDIGPCIVSTGDVACPAGPYTTRHVLSDGKYQDNRTCKNNDCVCGETVGGTCTGNTVYLYSSDTCSSSDYVSIPANGQCVSISGQNVSALVSGSLGGSPTCKVTGAGITDGSIVPSKLTFCCMP